MQPTQHIEALQYLATPEGKALLLEASRLPNDRLLRLSRLRQRLSVERATVAVELLELRSRAHDKFAMAQTLFFTKEGLEQSTSESIADYRASRFPSGGRVFDACSGVGGDSLALLRHSEVVAVDTNPVALTCLRLNAEVVCPERTAHLYTLCADVTTLKLSRGYTAAFVDPSRRTEGQFGERRRVRSSADYSPPLEWVQSLRASIPDVVVKISPAVDEGVLREQTEAQVEFISVKGECREAVLWFGGLAKEESRPLELDGVQCYTAVLLGKGETPLVFSPFLCEPPAVVSPQAYLYEPDPAIIRAHLVPQLASQLNAGLLSPHIAYLTSDSLTETPFATAYRVLEAMPFRIKEVQKWLRREGRRVEIVKKRGVEVEPQEVRKSLLGVNPTAPPLTLVLTPHLGRVFALLCERGLYYDSPFEPAAPLEDWEVLRER